ncbi:MAG: malto-oligosyltrehalose synthase [candidate division KSB1 bacterium]|nr:malto-oligosyltrehalose synthase [candidate division KSB1 bacterium]
MKYEPSAVYRVQLNQNFNFDQAAGIAGYLKDLGVSHLYCSPILQAAPGSSHGYDVVDPSRLNQELGGEEAYLRLCERLAELKMSQLLDMVPNHMAITGPENPWWWDVLENGPSSRFASYFDVDWDPANAPYSNLMLLPVLGDHYGRVLENNEFKLAHNQGWFTITYYDVEFPVSPRSLASLLETVAHRSHSEKISFIAGALQNLPVATATDRKSVQRRHRDKQVLGELLHNLCLKNERIAQIIDEVVEEINQNPDALDALFGEQNYRVAFWRKAEQEIAYRRFFDIQSLVGLRMEDEQVFQDTHQLIFKLIADGHVEGLRIDHPDGLFDPRTYFKRLSDRYSGLWVLAEKILEPDEHLRQSWPISGTSGYDFLNLVNGLFVQPEHEQLFTEFWSENSGLDNDYEQLVYEKKHQVMQQMLGSDVNTLTALLLEIAEGHRRHRDYNRGQVHQAIREIAACFPVYRTYVQAEEYEISDNDIRYIEEAVGRARENRKDLGVDLFEFIRDILMLRIRGERESTFVMRFQQFSAPVMAKGVEDTTFYVYNRLVSLNEVGGSPDQFGRPLKDFHEHNSEIQRHWPDALLTLSTHDTKRSEDVRSRLNVLSEIPDQWISAVRDWMQKNAQYKQNEYPDFNTEYLFYQNLIGAWPVDKQRMLDYMQKAIREAKVYTSWTDQNEEYEKAVVDFIEQVYADKSCIKNIESFVDDIKTAGYMNSLAQTLLKCTAPGIPDMYQGTELWDYSLVDPDNRRPVDFQRRAKLLKSCNKLNAAQALAHLQDGTVKLWLIRRVLKIRSQYSKEFANGGYTPMQVEGEHKDSFIAYRRGTRIVVLVPRWWMTNKGEWPETRFTLPEGDWQNALTDEIRQGGSYAVQELLATFPMACFIREE